MTGKPQLAHFALAPTMQICLYYHNHYGVCVCVSDVSVYELEMLIFLDETECDRQFFLRKYAYSLWGKPARSQSLWLGENAFQCLHSSQFMALLTVKYLKVP